MQEPKSGTRLFLRQAKEDFLHTGAIAPSSRFLARAVTWLPRARSVSARKNKDCTCTTGSPWYGNSAPYRRRRTSLNAAAAPSASPLSKDA